MENVMRVLLTLVAPALLAVAAAGCTYEHHDHYPRQARYCPPPPHVEVRHAYYPRYDHHHGYYRGDPDCR
jgi:hypothetical protein